VFCPNCGTQNPEAAQTCSKCGFHLKSVAAPKFKGTMLMMNHSASTPPPPAPGPRGGSSAPPPGVPVQRPGSGPPGAHPHAIPSKLKGTMVGVAPPMAGMARGPSPVAVPPAGTSYLANPPAPAGMPLGVEAGSAFSPPVPQGGVNPLGGTLAAENPAFPPYGAPGLPSPYAPPGHVPSGTQVMPGVGMGGPVYSPYAPPAGGGSPSGAPPAQSAPPYEEPPGSVNPYGARPPNAYGGAPGFGTPLPPPPIGQSAAPAAALAPYAGSSGGVSASARPSSLPLRKRNALLTFLLPLLVIFGGIVLSALLSLIAPALRSVGTLVVLAGAVWSLLLAIVMTNELRSVTRNDAFVWWPILVPFYGMYWAWILVPQEVAKAKQLRAVQRPPQSIVLYIFFWHFALASDLNDLAT
jgi:hypothetical protein